MVVFFCFQKNWFIVKPNLSQIATTILPKNAEVYWVQKMKTKRNNSDLASYLYIVFQMKAEKKLKFFKVGEGNHLPSQLENQSNKENTEIDKKVYLKFLSFMNQCRWQKLKERINQFYGRNFAIKYRDSYKFKEQWEDYLKEEEKPFMDIIQDENFVFRLMYWFVMLSNTLVVWAMSLLRVFRPHLPLDDLGYGVMVIGLLGRVCSIILKIYSKCQLMQIVKAKIIIKSIFLDTLILLYFMLSPWEVFELSEILVLFEIYVWVKLFSQAKKIYKQVKLLTVSLLYESKLKIIDLMITSLIITHFGSLIIYAASWNHQDSSWVISAGIDNADYFTQYIYSFYFCSTTILTIGYGDMTPKNVTEVIVVTLIEFIGVIIFAYIINQIGHTLSLMRQSEEELEKDMKTLRRIEKCYNIDQLLIKRAKNYLAQHESVVDHLTSEEENKLYGKLNQDLSSQLILEKSLTVIKTSIFFLCRWTKDMQSSVASHIQKVLLAPKEKLIQPVGNQRIYIVKFGHSKKDYRRFLKSIHRNNKSQIGANIYGYTSVISTKPCALDAVASDFTTCYFINKENFLKCVNRNKSDKQYYHQIKTKIDLSQFCEAYEAPSILNIRQHFNPSRTILIRKQKVKLQKLTNKRQYCARNNRKCLKSHLEKYNEIQRAIKDKILYNSIDLQEGTLIFMDNEERDGTTEGEARKMDRRKSYEEEIRETKKTIVTLLNPTNEKSVGLLNKNDLPEYFQRSKEYPNYFPYCNLQEILHCLDNENFGLKPKGDKQQTKVSIKRMRSKKV